MIQTTKQIFFECVSCGTGMGIFINYDGTQGKHRTSFEAPINKFVGIRKGGLIPDKGCPDCGKETLIKD